MLFRSTTETAENAELLEQTSNIACTLSTASLRHVDYQIVTAETAERKLSLCKQIRAWRLHGGGWAERSLGISTQRLHKLFYFLKKHGKRSYDVPISSV